MFYVDARGVYRHRAFDRLEWLDYGFGTRHTPDWIPGPTAIVKQVHSAICLHADGQTGVLGHADGIVTATPGTWVAIRTADCVPILLADDQNHAVAAVHAGWRGTAARIAEEATRALVQRYGARLEGLDAVIGPAICGQCYEVGPEVAREFRPWFPERADLEGKARVDLREANRRQLIHAGMDPERVHSGAPCTYCEAGQFYSYRREPADRGRMVSAIVVR